MVRGFCLLPPWTPPSLPLPPPTWLVRPYTAFCKTQTSGRGEQSWNQARGRERKNARLLPALQLPGEEDRVLFCFWGARELPISQESR